MPYTGDLQNSATDRVRSRVGDVYDDFELMTDAEYQYYIDLFNGNEKRAVKDVLVVILFRLTRFTRERTGDMEVYGSEWFKNYRNALMDMTKNPELLLSDIMPYGGGISRAVMSANDNNPDDVPPLAYIGQTDGVKSYEL